MSIGITDFLHTQSKPEPFDSLYKSYKNNLNHRLFQNIKRYIYFISQSRELVKKILNLLLTH